jgi:hypothetical protein
VWVLSWVLLVPIPNLIAQEDRLSGVEISRLWARATPPGVQMGVVYLDIANGRDNSIELTGVSSPAAIRAEVHESLSADGMMKMQKRETLAIPGGTELTFAPGGLHIMLMGLNAPLRAGDEFQLTLHFSGQTDLTLQVPVLPVAQLAYPE